MNFPHLFSPLEIRGKRLKNRIMSSGHDTSMPTDNLVNEPLVAYHRARARGGAGLIVMQVAGVHDSARYTSHVLMATDDACIPGYRRVAEACHAEGCVVLSQIFHPGREIMESADGLLAVAYSASASPNERFRVMPRELDQPLIDEIVAGYAAAARRLHQAGLDGVEVVASHGYLPAQFLNPRVNRRTDGYNGDLDARLRFLREVLAAVRAATSEDFIVGLRLSADERDPRVSAKASRCRRPRRSRASWTTCTSSPALRPPSAAPSISSRRWPSSRPTWPAKPVPSRRAWRSRCSSPGASTSPRRPRPSSPEARPTSAA